eukprot:EG_transcript_25025
MKQPFQERSISKFIVETMANGQWLPPPELQGFLRHIQHGQAEESWRFLWKPPGKATFSSLIKHSNTPTPEGTVSVTNLAFYLTPGLFYHPLSFLFYRPVLSRIRPFGQSLSCKNFVLFFENWWEVVHFS